MSSHPRFSLGSGGVAGCGWVGGEAAVGGDVFEDLVDHVEDVGVVDGVDVPAALAAGRDDAGQAEFAEVLAGGGDADADPVGERAYVVLALGRQGHQVQPDRRREHRERAGGGVELGSGGFRGCAHRGVIVTFPEVPRYSAGRG